MVESKSETHSHPAMPTHAALGLLLALAINLGQLSAASAAEFTCPSDKTYWRDHPAAWQVQSLVLGSPANPEHTYGQERAIAILRMTLTSDASVTLARQLIVAKLNVANGSDPAPVASVIADADNLLGGYQQALPYSIANSSNAGKAMTAKASKLGSYNTGALTKTCGRPPIANAGADQQVAIGARVSLDASGSRDPDGQSLTFSWVFVTRPPGSAAVLSKATGSRPSFTADLAGAYLLQLIVSDGKVRSEPDQVSIQAGNGGPINRPPLANAGPDQSVVLGATVIADGRLSSDPDGDALGFQWVLAQRPVGSSAAVTSAAATASLTPDVAGDYRLALTVTDGRGASATDDLRITVIQPNRSPVANAGPDRTVGTGNAVPLSGLSSTDPDGDALTFHWVLSEVPASSAAGLTDADTATPTLTPDLAGAYAVTLTVTDPQGLGASDFVLITAVAGNRPPRADAGPNQQVTRGANVALNGTASRDPDLDPISFRWTLIQRPTGSLSAITGATAATPSFATDRGGVYVAQLVVNDGLTDSAPDTVEILAAVPPNQPPVITSDPVIAAAAGTAYSYDVDATDAEDPGLLTYALLTRPSGMTIDPSSGLVHWTPSTSQVGAQNVSVRVRDPDGLTDIQSFSVQVAAPSTPMALDDQYEAIVGRTLTVDAAGVLGNDTGGNGPLTARLVREPANGVLALDANGAFTYTPHNVTPGNTVQITGGNLALAIPGVTVSSNGVMVYGDSVYGDLGFADRAFDGRIATSWVGNGVVGPFVEIAFPQDVSISKLQIFGHRHPGLARASPATTLGAVQLRDASGAVVFESAVSLEGTFGDAVVPVPHVTGVRRVRFQGPNGTVAVGGPFEGIAEMRVIGDATIPRPAAPADSNLAQLLAVTARASSELLPFFPIQAGIDDGSRSWYSTDTLGGGSQPFYEIEFPQNVNVTYLEVKNANSTPEGFFSSNPVSCFGRYQLLDAAATPLFDTGILNSPSGLLSTNALSMAVPNVAGVRRARYTLTTDCTGFPLGFGEFRVFGTTETPVPTLNVVPAREAFFGGLIHSTPLVVNITDDNGDGLINSHDIPDILAVIENSADRLGGVIRAVSGDDAHELPNFAAGAPDLVGVWADIAAADIDGDGIVEIVAPHRNGQQLIAFEHTGEVKWLSTVKSLPGNSPAETPAGGGGAVAIANLDGAGAPEIIIGASVYDAAGVLIGDGRDLGGTSGSVGLRSANSAVADIDLDGVPELVAGPTAYRLVGGVLTRAWQRSDRQDGYAGIGNFDDDPFAELVIVGTAWSTC